MSNGYSGYYDEENGICWDDEYYDEGGSRPYDITDAGRTPIGTSPEFFLWEAILDAADRFWGDKSGGSD